VGLGARDAHLGGARIQSVTIPEGFDLNQIIPALAKALEVPEDSVSAAVRDTALLRRLDIPTPDARGLPVPETYTFTPGTSAREAVARMVAEFERRWEPAWDAKLAAFAMTRHDAVTLASIVEKEARKPRSGR
jgi:UPF0755 protein